MSKATELDSLIGNINRNVPEDFEDAEKRLKRIAEALDLRGGEDSYWNHVSCPIRKGYLSTRKGLELLHEALILNTEINRVMRGHFTTEEHSTPACKLSISARTLFWEKFYKSHRMQICEAIVEAATHKDEKK